MLASNAAENLKNDGWCFWLLSPFSVADRVPQGKLRNASLRGLGVAVTEQRFAGSQGSQSRKNGNQEAKDTLDRINPSEPKEYRKNQSPREEEDVFMAEPYSIRRKQT